MSLTIKDLLQKLVRIPSVNPFFSESPAEEGGEACLTTFLQNYFDDRGWPWLRQRVHAGRDNILAVVRGESTGNENSIQLWEAHQDTVGVQGMRIDPFACEQRENRIWGRGACDNKGSIAAMLSALVQVQESGRPHPTILIACTINEECGFSGAKSLCRIWDHAQQVSGEVTGPLALSEARALRPRQAIVGEPTLLDVVVAHKGIVRWRCHARGRAAHSSQPEQGVNAIVGMSAVVQAIEQFRCNELSPRGAHPLCGGPTVCVSTIRGGSGVNTVPDEAVIDIDRRLAPGEGIDEAYRELIAYIAEHADTGSVQIEHEPPWLDSLGLEGEQNRAWAEHVAEVARDTVGAGRLIGVPYGTNAPAFAEIGIPTVVFGPGSIEQAHTDDEWLAVDQLTRAVEVLSRLACLPCD